ncbi:MULTISPECIES: hypothetical protein [unclassified Mesorhizobium]|uniref:hypothetical protein n=1 Tax=unclassified Mesorhizobium TaxID=325217 RepID=UPI003014A3BD
MNTFERASAQTHRLARKMLREGVQRDSADSKEQPKQEDVPEESTPFDDGVQFSDGTGFE